MARSNGRGRKSGRITRKGSSSPRRSLAKTPTSTRRGGTRKMPRAVKRSAQAQRTIGYAVVGLGHIAQVAVLPGFKHAENAKLVALVSSDADKLQELGRKYKVKNLFSYDQLEECLSLPEVDAVYIALPNDMHEAFTLRAAKQGKHVLCEKPMEISSEKCQRMIQACEDAGVKLMIAYRLHFEAANLHAVELIADGKIGKPKFFSSDFAFQVKPDNIRTQSERGGGVLWDIGVYCLNAARYLFRAEPTEVFAFATKGEDERFGEIEETVACVMRFPDQRLASFNVSFGSAAVATFRVVGTEGDICLDQAYEYVGGREMWITIDEKTREKKFKAVDQFAAELEYFADCILEGRDPEPDGYEGLLDVKVIEALYQSIRTGQPVKLDTAGLKRGARPDESQVFEKPPLEKPDTVEVEAPSS